MSKKHIKRLKVFVLVFLDAITIAGLFLASCYGTYHFQMTSEATRNYFIVGSVDVLTTIMAFLIFGVYRMDTDNFGLFETLRVMAITFVINVVIYVAMIVFSSESLPRLNAAIWLMAACCEVLFIVVYRFAKRVSRAIKWRHINKNKGLRTLVIGAGAAGKVILDDSRTNPARDITIIGFIDDDPGKIGNTLSGVKILGPISAVAEFVKLYKAEEVLIGIHNLSDERRHQILEYLRPCDVRIRILPSFNDEGIHDLKAVDIDLNEILGRGGISIDEKAAESSFKNSNILITGAGGSIGQEIARVLLDYQPKTIILFDQYENTLFDIQHDLMARIYKKQYHDTTVLARVGSTSDERSLNTIFMETRPTFVFHAASYKNVPFMEEAPRQAVISNVIGADNVAKIAGKYNVRKIILCSTDKAISTTNVMGETKRLSELVFAARYHDFPNTVYCSVRFGNVLGSNGSVIPLFTRQIANKGPVTVTSPNTDRYFLTINEAALLIIESLLLAEKSQIMTLEMGEPIKIITIAEQMIRQAGYVPYKDIPIVFVGLRSGEHEHENLVSPNCVYSKTSNQRILASPSETLLSAEKISSALIAAIRNQNDDGIKKAIEDLLHKASPSN
jgi:FlaA1/EpsC-like NDP-sugar epimerase